MQTILAMMHRRRHTLASHLAALLIYTLIAVVLTWPLVTHPGTGIIGGLESYNFTFEDASQNIWNIWWVGYALARGHNPFWSAMLYYPEGVQLYIQTLNLAGVLPVLPIHYLFGPVLAYNCAVLLTMILVGYAGFLLARAFVPTLLEPLLAGALLTASPFHLMKLQGNHLNLLSIQWMVLYILALIWLDRHRDRRAILLAAATAVLVVLTDWYWTLACTLFTIVWAALGLLCGPERSRLLRAYLWLGALTLIITAPLLAGIWHVHTSLPLNETFTNPQWHREVQGFSSDALGLFFPALWPFLSPEQTLAMLRQLNPNTDHFFPEGWYTAAGWVLLALAALGIWATGRNHWRMLVAGIVMWLLSLGPVLTFAGVNTGLVLPYALLQEVPLFAIARRPSHFAALCVIIAVVFATLGLQHLARHLTLRYRGILLVGIAVLASLELWPTPWLSYPFEIDPLFARLRATPGIVADLPYEQHWSSRSLRNQTLHEQPILGGYVARRPPYETLRFVPLLSQIGLMQIWQADVVPLDGAALQTMQCYYRLRYVVVRVDQVSEKQRRNLATLLTKLTGAPLAPSYATEQYLVYELPLFDRHCQPFVYLGKGWHDLETDGARHWRWASDNNELWLVNPTTTTTTVFLRLSAEPLTRTTEAELWSGANRIARWHIGSGKRQYTLAFSLPPGQTSLTLRATATSDPNSHRRISFTLTDLQLVSTVLASKS